MTAFLKKYMRPAYKSISRALGYSLTLGTSEAWAAFSTIAAHRLSLEDRAGMAFATLSSLDPAQAEQVAAAALRAAGMPASSFLGAMLEARLWAHSATETERKAYCLACFEVMAEANQSAFLQRATAMEAAA
ncbi:hypothetical protein [Fluviibacterium sp. S390]|uniref:hypothetical protein n=1 Tax=Fluviibacterium sp. S390 TaxID=3415139 RepID=UPI003C7CF800